MEKKSFNDRVNEEILRLDEEYPYLMSDIRAIFEKNNGKKMKKKCCNFFYEELSNVTIEQRILSIPEMEDNEKRCEWFLGWLKENYNQDTGNDDVWIIYDDSFEKNCFGTDLLPINRRVIERVKRKHDGTGTLCGNIYTEELLEIIDNTIEKNKTDKNVRDILRLSFVKERTKLLKEITDEIIPWEFGLESKFFFEKNPFETMNGMITESKLWKIMSELDECSVEFLSDNVGLYNEYGVDKYNFVSTFEKVTTEIINEIARIAFNFKWHPYMVKFFSLYDCPLEYIDIRKEKNKEKLLINYKAKC